jgi:Fur family transcriptional regulator, iron response regulator
MPRLAGPDFPANVLREIVVHPEITRPTVSDPDHITCAEARAGGTECGCAIGAKLRDAGVRPTRQRVVLTELLFGKGDRHITAEQLHQEAVEIGERVSLATVYNTLHQLRSAGLVRELAIDAQRAYFDTNTSNHSHFVIEPTGEVVDIPNGSIRVDGLPLPPEGFTSSHVDVVVRVRRT